MGNRRGDGRGDEGSRSDGSHSDSRSGDEGSSSNGSHSDVNGEGASYKSSDGSDSDSRSGDTIADQHVSADRNPRPGGGSHRVGPNEMILAYVPASPFTMGSRDDDPIAYDIEKPPYEVYVEGFWIARTEVTNAEYARCVEAGV